MSRSRIRQLNGFTLLEIIIAITVLAVVMTVVYASLTTILRSKTILDDERDIQEVASSVLGRLNRELQEVARAIPLLPACGTSSNTDQKNEYFRGLKSGGSDDREDSITFIATGAGQYIPNGKTNTGAVQINYQIAKDPDNGNKLSLFREELPYRRPIETACESRIAFPVSANVTSLEFYYFDSKEQKWYDEWDSKIKLEIPELIGFRIGVKSSKGIEKFFSSMVSTVRLK